MKDGRADGPQTENEKNARDGSFAPEVKSRFKLKNLARKTDRGGDNHRPCS